MRREANATSDTLSHTRMLQPADSPLFVEAAALITPKLAAFGALMFGERIGWSVKEMWVNVLDSGGRQAMHNHATLTVVTGLALPIDIVAGLLGMNVGGIPLAQDAHGFYVIVGLIAAFMALVGRLAFRKRD